MADPGFKSMVFYEYGKFARIPIASSTLVVHCTGFPGSIRILQFATMFIDSDPQHGLVACVLF